MDFALYSDVVLLRDCPDKNVSAGDIGTCLHMIFDCQLVKIVRR